MIEKRLDVLLKYLNTLGNLVTSDLELYYVETCEQLVKAIKYELKEDKSKEEK